MCIRDSSSSYYNQLVNTSVTSRSWNSAENLAAASPYYNYALALDYNSDRVPGKGSAIFLHCFTASADNGSAGCIRLPESRAKELVQTATEKTRIVIAADITPVSYTHLDVYKRQVLRLWESGDDAGRG